MGQHVTPGPHPRKIEVSGAHRHGQSCPVGRHGKIEVRGANGPGDMGKERRMRLACVFWARKERPDGAAELTTFFSLGKYLTP